MPENQPVQYGPTRAVLTLFEYDPPVVFMIDTHNVAVATGGLPDHKFEAIRQGIASILGPMGGPAPTQGIKRHPSPEDEPERGKSKGKGKGKKKGHDKLKKDHPATPDSADTPDEPADEIPVEPLPDVIDPETLEPVPGDINLSDDAAFMPVVVNAASEVIPALFEQWYAEKYGTHGTEDGYPDPALHPQLVREYLDDTQN